MNPMAHQRITPKPTSSRPALHRLAFAASAIFVNIASAQFGLYSPDYLNGSAWDRMRPIDPGSADLGPLGIPSRLLSRNLRQDRDFSILYQGFAADGSSWFARRDAGITAVFPRSSYSPGANGDIALIPPDTKFIICEPASGYADILGLSKPPAGIYIDPSHGLRIDGRLESLIDPTRDPTRPWLEHRSPASPRKGMRALLINAGNRDRASSARREP